MQGPITVPPFQTRRNIHFPRQTWDFVLLCILELIYLWVLQLCIFQRPPFYLSSRASSPSTYHPRPMATVHTSPLLSRSTENCAYTYLSSRLSPPMLTCLGGAACVRNILATILTHTPKINTPVTSSWMNARISTPTSLRLILRPRSTIFASSTNPGFSFSADSSLPRNDGILTRYISL